MGFLSNLDAQKNTSKNNHHLIAVIPTKLARPYSQHQRIVMMRPAQNVKVTGMSGFITVKKKLTQKIHYHTFAVSINDEGL